MNLIFLGPPGAGKGTMAVRLSNELNIPHISTGDIIRAAIRNETALGKQVEQIVEAGKLVSDDLTIALVKERLENDDTVNGFILDGFPRTLVQADALAKLCSIDCAVNFELKETEVVKRLSGRRVHKASGRTYHVLFSPPKAVDKDDLTGEELWQRPDDQEDSILTRLAVYHDQTAPLESYYRNLGLLVDLDSSPAPDQVYQDLKKSLSI